MMLCNLCNDFTCGILSLEFPEPKWATGRDKADEPSEAEETSSPILYAHEQRDGAWYTFRHRSFFDIKRTANDGCKLCLLLHNERLCTMPELPSCSEVTLAHPAWIEVQLGPLSQDASFELYTELGADVNIFGAPFYRPFQKFQFYDVVGGLFPLPGICLGRMIQQSTDSEEIFALAKRWIRNCVSRHGTVCLRRSETPLPTRLVDVGPEDGSQDPFLFVSDDGQTGKYVALSHCWGTAEKLITKQANYSALQKRIPWFQLPKTFQDAVTVTRKLGYQWLWIDCYCIIQDLKKDWLAEGAKMGDIYANSIFTISAMGAEDSFAGLICERNIGISNDSVVIEHVPTKGERRSVGVRRMPLNFTEAMNKSTLDTRAWCMQERILPPALLHFGKSQISWECCSGVSAEDRLFVSKIYHPFSKAMPLFQFGMNRDVEEIKDNYLLWYAFVEHYSYKRFTKPTVDKFAAIQGLATRLAHLFGDEYAAGLWRDDLHRGLAWERVHNWKIEEDGPLGGKASPLAPSWSWAGIKTPVSYSMFETYSRRISASTDIHVSSVRLQTSWRKTENLQTYGEIHLSGQLQSVVYRPILGPGADPGRGTIEKTTTPKCLRLKLFATRRRGTHCQRIASWIPELSHTSDGRSPDKSRNPSHTSSRALFFRRQRPSKKLSCVLDCDWQRTRTCYCLHLADWDDHTNYLILERLLPTSPPTLHKSALTHQGSFRRIGVGWDSTGGFAEKAMDFVPMNEAQLRQIGMYMRGFGFGDGNLNAGARHFFEGVERSCLTLV